jgi:hypothetical protein
MEATTRTAAGQGLEHPERVLHQLELAAEAVRRNDLEPAAHYTGNALLMLKQALAPKRATRRAKPAAAPVTA